MTEVRGIPDQSALPSLCMNYQSTFTLTPPNGAVGTWQFDGTLIPHPVCFMYYTATSSVGTGVGTLLNSQIDGATHALKFASFKALAQRWRLAYMSVTVYQDGPDLANQGTLVVAQPPVSPRARSISSLTPTAPPPAFTWAGPVCAPAKVCEWTHEDMPDFTRSQAMPNAYFNKSKDGAYVPLKLTETCQDWVSEEDEICVGQFVPALPASSANNGVYQLVNSLTQCYPFVDLTNVWQDGNGFLKGQSTSKPLSGNWAHISARNLAVTTSYSFFVRCGIEMQVSPSSTLSPQLKLSPPYDPVALNTYFSVCRELKDGYPADYNTTGKLWGVIKDALAALDPFVNLLPGARVIRPIGQAGVAVGDAVVNRMKINKKKRKNKKKKKMLQLAGVPTQANMAAFSGARAAAQPRRTRRLRTGVVRRRR